MRGRSGNGGRRRRRRGVSDLGTSSSFFSFLLFFFDFHPQLAERRPDLNHVSFSITEPLHDTRKPRRDLDRCFIGLDVAKRVKLLDFVADFDPPRDDLYFFESFSRLGQRDGDEFRSFGIGRRSVEGAGSVGGEGAGSVGCEGAARAWNEVGRRWRRRRTRLSRRREGTAESTDACRRWESSRAVSFSRRGGLAANTRMQPRRGPVSRCCARERAQRPRTEEQELG